MRPNIKVMAPFAELIEKKKRGHELTEAEVRRFVEGVTTGDVSDAQAVALMMATWFVGMTDREATALALAMARSGEMLDLSPLGRCVDKHSSGGVGDKTTLIVGPLAAAAGARVVKLSGRGLGHTGGTLDKLESIPGFRADLSAAEFRRAGEAGLVVAGQSADLAPADKKLYALRDVTATVDSVPLIAASIMSKKLAAGAQGIVLDVKCGRGAFMQDQAGAEALAALMVSIGRSAGREMAAAITDMNAPLGVAAGNAVEVAEAVRVLRGEERGLLCDLCLELAARMVLVGGAASELAEAESAVQEALDSGRALEALRAMVERQGGDARCIDEQSRLPQPAMTCDVRAPWSGEIGGIDALAVGRACVALGAGRTREGESVDPGAGVMLRARVGNTVASGEALATVGASTVERLQEGAALVQTAFSCGDGYVGNSLVFRWC